MDVLFVYHNPVTKKSKVIECADAKKLHKKMKQDGFLHTTTLNPAAFIEILMSISNSQILIQVDDLKDESPF